jgi:putative copper resistance protein D
MLDIWTFVTPLFRWLFYPSMLLATGGVGFELLMRPWMPQEIRNFVRRVTARAALAALVLALLQVPVAAGNFGGDLASAIDPLLLTLVVKAPVGLAALVAAGGLALLLVVERMTIAVPGVIRILPPAIVIISMTLVGHATSREGATGVLTGVLLSLHLAGIGFWLAALLPLRRMCLATADDSAPVALAALAEEFGRLALVLVVMLLVAGVCYAALLVGSVAALFGTGYGIALLAKVALVSGMLLVAALNRFRLVPALQAGETGAALRLRRSIEIEMLLAGGILLATSLLTTSFTLPMGGM